MSSAVPPAYRCFKVVKNQSDPPADYARMPKDLCDAVALFTMTGQSACAEKCRSCVDSILEILQRGPEGNKNVNIGSACVCWRCGFVGIPKNAADIGLQTTEVSTSASLCVCSACGEFEDTNPVCGKQPDGTVIPWIEHSQRAEEEK